MDGSVLMLLSGLSPHTRHLRVEPRCSLLFLGAPTTANPQTTPRLTIIGDARPDLVLNTEHTSIKDSLETLSSFVLGHLGPVD